MAVAVEAPDGLLLAQLRLRVPSGWALAASVLTVLGAALAAGRLRASRVLLGLGSLGLGPGRVFLLAAAFGAGLGALAATVPAPAPAELGWVRVDGGWVRGEEVLPDRPEGRVGRPPAGGSVLPPAVAVGTGAAAGLAGAALGLSGGATGPVLVGALLLVGEAVAAGLVERAALPAAARWGPAVALAAVALAAARRARLR